MGDISRIKEIARRIHFSSKDQSGNQYGFSINGEFFAIQTKEGINIFELSKAFDIATGNYIGTHKEREIEKQLDDLSQKIRDVGEPKYTIREVLKMIEDNEDLRIEGWVSLGYFKAWVTLATDEVMRKLKDES